MSVQIQQLPPDAVYAALHSRPEGLAAEEIVIAHVHAEEDHPVFRRGPHRQAIGGLHPLDILGRHVLDEVHLARQKRGDPRGRVLDGRILDPGHLKREFPEEEIIGMLDEMRGEAS